MKFKQKYFIGTIIILAFIISFIYTNDLILRIITIFGFIASCFQIYQFLEDKKQHEKIVDTIKSLREQNPNFTPEQEDVLNYIDELANS